LQLRTGNPFLLAFVGASTSKMKATSPDHHHALAVMLY